MPGMPREDLTAQTALFLLQTELSTEDELFRWLENYLRRHFRLTFPGVDPGELARAIVLHAIEHKWYTEDARAWRRYIVHTRRGVLRQLLRQRASETDPDHLSASSDEEDRLIAGLDGEETASAGPPPPHRPWDPTGEYFTPDEVARLTQRSRRTIYNWIQSKVIATQVRRRRRVITAEEVKRLKGSLPRAVAIKLLAQRRATSGRDNVTATRKWVYRREKAGDSLEDILFRVLGRRVKLI
jgi:excisionase family DNA binding protein